MGSLAWSAQALAVCRPSQFMQIPSLLAARSCLCRSGAVMQIQPCLCRSGPPFSQILSLFTQSPPCLCRLHPCLHRQRPCLQTLSLFTLTLTLLNSIPALFTQASFLTAEVLAVCRVPTAWDQQQQARGPVSVCLAGHGLTGAGSAVLGACWKEGEGVCWEPPAQDPAKVAPLLPRLWHCF